MILLTAAFMEPMKWSESEAVDNKPLLFGNESLPQALKYLEVLLKSEGQRPQVVGWTQVKMKQFPSLPTDLWGLRGRDQTQSRRLRRLRFKDEGEELKHFKGAGVWGRFL